MTSTTGQDKQRAILTKHLTVLLGSDGAEDVLEHLLTIESSEDLLDYLTQFLGSAPDAQWREFVDNLGRVQRGELLHDDGDDIFSSYEGIGNHNNTKVVESTSRPRKNPTSLVTLTKKVPPPRLPVVSLNLQTSSQSATKPSTNTAAKKKSSCTETKTKENQQSRASKDSLPTNEPIKRRTKGKAVVECGCFGTMHPALTNCLFCGRISCEQEGYDHCPFCGFLVEKVETPHGSETAENSEAWKHKERLLRYERESAQRTVILDDQADYFNNKTAAWLNEDEQREAGKQEQQRHDDMHTRKTMQLNLTNL